MKKKFILLFFVLQMPLAMAYESLYPETPPGKIEIKQLPERVMLKATGTGNYFSGDDGLFRKLFRFISDNDIAMTIPVEAEIAPGSMAFFVGEEDKAKEFSSNSDVAVINAPVRLVAAIGYRGSYTKKQYMENKQHLADWLNTQTQYTAAGEAYAVYWDGPFTPWFLKRAEVHIPVRRI